MKKTILLLIFVTLLIQNNFAQGTSVITAEQFCSGGSQLVFPNVTGEPNSSEVGCLYTIPNAAYYYITIDQPGDLVFTISQENNLGDPIDVDFIAWGPFTSIAAADAAITLTDCASCPNNTTDPNFYPYAPDFITDCSYSSNPTETLTINNALPGQIYIVLITNYDGGAGNISIQQTGGLGTTSCGDIPVCGGVFLDSGGDTGSYSNNQNETTIIYPFVAGGTVTTTFTMFDVASGDFLTVYDGPDTSSPSLGSYTGTTNPGPFTSTHASGTLTFVFTSNASGVGAGWSADIVCNPPPLIPACGTQFYDSGGATGDYSSNENETTTLYPNSPGDAITATFTAFNLENNWDYLYVYDGPNTTSPLIATLTGTTIPGPFTSSHPSGALTFVFTSDSSVNRAGWAADISCAPYVPPVVCGSNFYDSGGIAGNYPNSVNQTTTFVPDIPGTAITATFTAFNTEATYDVLRIYDGPDATSPLLGAFSGTTLPPTFTSSHVTGALTFVFTSDGSVNRAGWVADITCTKITPTCGETFYDSGGIAGNYSNNENETTVITPINPGDAVTTTFTAFNLDSGDTLEVFDGTTSLGTFSGTTIPGPFTSTDPSGELTFIFTSNGSGTQSGWAADITCSILCDLVITSSNVPLGADACDLDYAELTTNSLGSPGGTATIFSEDFSSGVIPTTWFRPSTDSNTYWEIHTDNNAGGTAPQIRLNPNPSSTNDSGEWSLESPSIDITGLTNLQLSLKQKIWHYLSSYTYSVFIETNVDGAGWVTRYNVSPVDATVDAETQTINLSSISGNNLQFRFRLQGQSFGLFYWYIDDILLTSDAPPTTPQITWAPAIGLYTDSALNTPYTGGISETVYAAPNGIQTYTATDQNGCSTDATVTRNRKVWNGSVSTDWYTANNWTPTGVPNNQNCVVIPNASTTNHSPIVSGTVTNPGLGKTLRVELNGDLELLPAADLIITDDITVDGKLILRNTSNLIQITNTGITNTGNIQMQRTAENMTAQSYVYWSSPVDNFAVTAVSPGSNLRYSWLPTVAGNGVGNHGDWQATTEIMQAAKGYIIRGISGTTPEGVPAANTVEYTGVARNGNIQIPILRGTHTGGTYPGVGSTLATHLDDNWNLIGNPYPSSISADTFIAQNAGLFDNTPDPNTPLIHGTVYLWTHTTAPSTIDDPFYGDYVYNYNPNDYIGYNSTGSNPSGFNGYIGAGQAFFVLMNDGATTPSNVTFNNAMRFDSSNPTHPTPFDNTTFYRPTQTGQTQENSSTIEKHRIWLDLIAPNNRANSILVGYIKNATNGIDRLFDGFELSETSTRFYSLIEDEKMAIQGKALPFQDTDLVPLGLVIPNAGNYTIAINAVDGLFESTNQAIFLEDTYTGIIHDLRGVPYSFNSGAGTFNDRFILRYTNQSLSLIDEQLLSGVLISAPNNTSIKVSSRFETIKSVSVYDVLGRSLFSTKNVNENEFIIDNITISNGSYIVKATLTNGLQKAQKVIINQ